jgi:hypothetical protein
MANYGFEIEPNFVPILWISQRCPNLMYSQSPHFSLPFFTIFLLKEKVGQE